MKLAFYKGMGEGGTLSQKLIHKGIARISSPHTHVELIFDDNLSFSSEFGVGPRIKDIQYTHPERWTFVNLPFITPEQARRVRQRADLLADLCYKGYLRYDTRGAVGCALTGVENPWKYFCSEVVYEVLAPEIAIPSLNNRMHPQRLLEVVQIVKDLATL